MITSTMWARVVSVSIVKIVEMRKQSAVNVFVTSEAIELSGSSPQPAVGRSLITGCLPFFYHRRQPSKSICRLMVASW